MKEENKGGKHFPSDRNAMRRSDHETLVSLTDTRMTLCTRFVRAAASVARRRRRPLSLLRVHRSCTLRAHERRRRFFPPPPPRHPSWSRYAGASHALLRYCDALYRRRRHCRRRRRRCRRRQNEIARNRMRRCSRAIDFPRAFRK